MVWSEVLRFISEPAALARLCAINLQTIRKKDEQFRSKSGLATVKFLYTGVKKLYIFCKTLFCILLVFNDIQVWHGGCHAENRK